MPAFVHARWNDYGSEGSTTTFKGPALTALNFDAQNTAVTALVDAVAGITLGLRVRYAVGNEFQTVSNATPAADANAQRERKWLIYYTDGIAMKTYQMELPCANLAHLDPNNREAANIGDAGPVDAFIAAFEAYHLSPDGNAVTVDKIVHVGRNL